MRRDAADAIREFCGHKKRIGRDALFADTDIETLTVIADALEEGRIG